MSAGLPPRGRERDSSECPGCGGSFIDLSSPRERERPKAAPLAPSFLPSGSLLRLRHPKRLATPASWTQGLLCHHQHYQPLLLLVPLCEAGPPPYSTCARRQEGEGRERGRVVSRGEGRLSGSLGGCLPGRSLAPSVRLKCREDFAIMITSGRLEKVARTRFNYPPIRRSSSFRMVG